MGGQHGGYRQLTAPPIMSNKGIVGRTLTEVVECPWNADARTRSQSTLYGALSNRTMVDAKVPTSLMYRTSAEDASANLGQKDVGPFKYFDREFSTNIYHTARWPIKGDPRQSSVGRFNVGVKH